MMDKLHVLGDVEDHGDGTYTITITPQTAPSPAHRHNGVLFSCILYSLSTTVVCIFTYIYN